MGKIKVVVTYSGNVEKAKDEFNKEMAKALKECKDEKPYH